MLPNRSHDDFLAQDSAEDDSSLEAVTSQPLSEAEIEDLLYGGERSTAERLALLQALRADLADRQGGDAGENEIGALLREIDDRITELRGADRDGGSGRIDFDPLAHRETLAPDSDELEAIEADDAASMEGDEEERE